MSYMALKDAFVLSGVRESKTKLNVVCCPEKFFTSYVIQYVIVMFAFYTIIITNQSSTKAIVWVLWRNG